MLYVSGPVLFSPEMTMHRRTNARNFFLYFHSGPGQTSGGGILSFSVVKNHSYPSMDSSADSQTALPLGEYAHT